MLKQKWKKSLPTLPTPYDLMKKCTEMKDDETKAIEEEKHRFIRLYTYLEDFQFLNDI